MTNLEKYNDAFVQVFGVSAEQLNSDFTSETAENWDSVTHMALIAALEDAFDILIGTDDVFALSSYDKGKDIIKKYEVVL